MDDGVREGGGDDAAVGVDLEVEVFVHGDIAREVGGPGIQVCGDGGAGRVLEAVRDEVLV